MKKLTALLLFMCALLCLALLGGCVDVSGDFEAAHKVAVSFDMLKSTGATGGEIAGTAERRLALDLLERELDEIDMRISELGVKEICLNTNVELTHQADAAAIAEGRWIVSVDVQNGAAKFEDRRYFYGQLFEFMCATYPFDSQRYALLNPFATYEEAPITGDRALPAPPSFVTADAQISPHMDAKELFCTLHCPPEYTAAQKALIAGDGYMRQKAEYIVEYAKAVTQSDLLAAQMSSFFSSPLYAERIYRVTDTRAVRMGETTTYPPAHVKVGDILTYGGGEIDENGDEILFLLDENFNRVYAPETSLLRMDTLDFDADRLLQDMGVYIILEPITEDLGIEFDLLPTTLSGRLDYFDAQNGGMLGSASLARAAQEFAKYDFGGKLYSIAPVKNLMSKEGSSAKASQYIIADDTLYIDVLNCTGASLREAIKTLTTAPA